MSGGSPLFDPDFCLLDDDADEVLLGLLARDNEPPPHYGLGHRREPMPAARKPANFDKAEFLRHMQGLIERREREEAEVFARERDA